jgi:lipopolysaccharide transport system permease protein
MSVFNPTQEIIIRPNQSWLHLDWRGIIQYRDLVLLMVRRDFIARYKQTILGPAWYIVSPVMTSLTFTMVFSKVLGVGTAGVPPVLFYLSGTLGWTYFSTLMTSTSSSLIHNAALFGKVYFPRLIVPVAMSISSCIAFSIQLCTFLAVLTYYATTDRIAISFPQVLTAIACLPLIVLHTAMLAMGFGLCMASITAKYRDFQHLTGFVLHLWMYATPVIFPFSHIVKKFPDHSWIAAINPMAAIIENIRALFFGTPSMPLPYVALSVGMAVIIFSVGILLYQRTARTFIDVI